VSVTRNRLKDALRASIESEDDALKERKPTSIARRKAAVKSGIKAARKSAGIEAEVEMAGKPVEVGLSRSEADQLKQLRDRIKAEGVSLSKDEILRLGLLLMKVAPTDVLVDASRSLQKLKPAKD